MKKQLCLTRHEASAVGDFIVKNTLPYSSMKRSVFLTGEAVCRCQKI